MVDIHNSLKRFEAARRRVASLDNAELLLAFLDHLEALGLSKLRVAKYASALCTILRNVEFDPAAATKSDVERVVAWINRQPFKEWTKHDLKLALRKLIQFAKNGSCDRKTPIPDEAAWIPLTVSEKDSRVKPEMLLTLDKVKAMIRVAENERDKALISILYEVAVRLAELLGMNVGSVEFRDEYCVITVHGKTGLKRIPIAASHKLILDWLEKHPRKGDLNAPLWASLRGKLGRVGDNLIAFLANRVPSFEELVKRPQAIVDFNVEQKYLAAMTVAEAMNRTAKNISKAKKFMEFVAECDDREFISAFFAFLHNNSLHARLLGDYWKGFVGRN